MKLKTLFAWFLALLVVGLTQTACSSDNSDPVSAPSLPTDMVGTWDFDDFTLTLDAKGNGIIEYNGETDDPYDVFTYTYSATKGSIDALCLDHQSIIFDNVRIDADGRLVLTLQNGNASQTVSGTKHTFIAVSPNQMWGTWTLQKTGEDYFRFTKTDVTITHDGTANGTWRTSGSSVWITLDGVKYEYIRNITVTDNVMKAHVYSEGYWYPITLLHTDNGGNTESGGGASQETVDNGSSTGDATPGTSDGSYWGE